MVRHCKGVLVLTRSSDTQIHEMTPMLRSESEMALNQFLFFHTLLMGPVIIWSAFFQRKLYRSRQLVPRRFSSSDDVHLGPCFLVLLQEDVILPGSRDHDDCSDDTSASTATRKWPTTGRPPKCCAASTKEIRKATWVAGNTFTRVPISSKRRASKLSSDMFWSWQNLSVSLRAKSFFSSLNFPRRYDNHCCSILWRTAGRFTIYQKFGRRKDCSVSFIPRKIKEFSWGDSIGLERPEV